MQINKNLFSYFTKFEIFLWFCSVFATLFSFIIFDRENFLVLSASLIGVTSLIYSAKGNPFGQVLMIIFSIIYGIISFESHYYGEMITYIGMTMPMAVLALISWIKNPYKGNKSQVEIKQIEKKEIHLMVILTVVVTVVFYFVLNYFNTASIILSSLSVTTTFIAVYLTYKRSKFFALAYACNDIVLIVLWILVAKEESSYISVVICFLAFLANDLYGFYNWRKMEKIQQK